MDRHAHRFAQPEPALTFDDVLLVPASSSVLPQQVFVSTSLCRGIALPLPVLAAAMDTVTEGPLALALAQLGGLGVLHKNQTVDAQAAQVRDVKAGASSAEGLSATDRQGRLLVAAAVGAGPEGVARARALVAAGCDLLVVDTAHGHSEGVLAAVRQLRQLWPDIPLMAGNIATAAAVEALAQAGADAVKVGIGPGSICTTRVVAGVGMPQLTAVLDCAVAARALGLGCVADGGVRYSGDLVKALAAGADAVMLGSLFAGADEAPGERVEAQGQFYKRYRGMGSVGAMQLGSKDRYFQATTSDAGKLVPEGVEGLVAAKGPLSALVHQLIGGLRAGMGYVGAATLADLRRAQYVRITPAGLRESHVHDLHAMAAAVNYQP